MPTDRKTLIRSRSFGVRVRAKEGLRQALVTQAQCVAERLREEGLIGKGIGAFITQTGLETLPATPTKVGAPAGV